MMARLPAMLHMLCGAWAKAGPTNRNANGSAANDNDFFMTVSSLPLEAIEIRPHTGFSWWLAIGGHLV
jgi:hypothetical protein